MSIPAYAAILISFLLLTVNSPLPQQTSYTRPPLWGGEVTIPGEAPFSFGEIPLEHLRMQKFPPDTDASVMILFDYGNTYIDREKTLIYHRHRRIKILTSDAFEEWGTHEIPYYSRGSTQHVRAVEAVTLNKGIDGSMVFNLLNPVDIFDERVSGDFRRIRFTMPALELGSVIKYRYEVTYKDPAYLPDWDFQTSEPVLWSEYNIRIPEYLEFYYVAKISR